uniref:Fcf2 pre-rRNA processing C-terminal domain-containing protein n=1 Tax=Arion vulgaris TaxID=1028688 RepID=A0A0B7BPQ8_9EUPU
MVNMAKQKIIIEDSDSSENASDASCDIIDLNSNDRKSEKTAENIADIQRKFQLSCVQKWDENTLSSCLKNYLQMTKQHDKETSPHVDITHSSTTNFVPWWEEFTKLDRHKNVVNSVSERDRDGDTYDSWFDKNAVEGSSWLCGSSSLSSRTLSSQGSEVEDIKVPSIYDNNPAPKGRRALKRDRKAEKAKDLGKKWFGMKAPDVDSKLKNDMDLIRMRSVLDPKRFYKHQDRKALPKYFQMGTVVDEGTDFYSSRLTKKQRKQTLVEELMADANVRQYNKKKYAELQQKMRGKRKFKNKPRKKD